MPTERRPFSVRSNPTLARGGTNGTGAPPSVQLERADASGTPPVRSTPNQTTHCGATATTGPNSAGNADAASNASSAPFDPPTRPTRPLRISGCRCSHSPAAATASTGSSHSAEGRGSTPKYAAASTAIPCGASRSPHHDGMPPPDPLSATTPGCGPSPSGTVNAPITPASSTGTTDGTKPSSSQPPRSRSELWRSAWRALGAVVENRRMADEAVGADQSVLDRVRSICAALRESEEGVLQGRPLFHVRRRRFAIFNGK